jgi:hypothetical protein
MPARRAVYDRLRAMLSCTRVTQPGVGPIVNPFHAIATHDEALEASQYRCKGTGKHDFF